MSKDRYINANDFADLIRNLDITVSGESAKWSDAKDSVLRLIEAFPSAEVSEVKRGAWYFTEYEYFTCSECGKSHFNFCDSTAEARRKLENGEVYPYCPECGAKMETEAPENE